MDFAITYNSQNSGFDFGVKDGDIAKNSGLETAVLVSLFTDRRAADDDVIPDGTDDRRGSWQDQYADEAGDLQGSRLWLLGREKQTVDVLQRAKDYAEEALAWLIDDGVARSVTVTAQWAGNSTMVIVALTIAIVLMDGGFHSVSVNYALEG